MLKKSYIIQQNENVNQAISQSLITKGLTDRKQNFKNNHKINFSMVIFPAISGG